MKTFQQFLTESGSDESVKYSDVPMYVKSVVYDIEQIVRKKLTGHESVECEIQYKKQHYAGEHWVIFLALGDLIDSKSVVNALFRLPTIKGYVKTAEPNDIELQIARSGSPKLKHRFEITARR